MKKRKLFTLIILVPLSMISFKRPESRKISYSVDPGFALVELFTSEGCSSCPPADEAVGKIGAWKKNIYVLSFHVDYWDYLGWKDSYSNAAFSARQQEYGKLFHLSSIYTPQIVVNGKDQFVGSNEGQLRSSVETSLNESPTVHIQLKISLDQNQITATATSSGSPENKISLALLQNKSTGFIQRGENKGKTLTHYYTVREFQTQTAGATNTFHIKIPEGLGTSDCSVVTFLQNPESGVILAASGSGIP